MLEFVATSAKRAGRLFCESIVHRFCTFTTFPNARPARTCNPLQKPTIASKQRAAKVHGRSMPLCITYSQYNTAVKSAHLVLLSAYYHNGTLPRVRTVKFIISIPFRIARHLLIHKIHRRDLGLSRSQIVDSHIDHFTHSLDNFCCFALSVVSV